MDKSFRACAISSSVVGSSPTVLPMSCFVAAWNSCRSHTVVLHVTVTVAFGACHLFPLLVTHGCVPRPYHSVLVGFEGSHSDCGWSLLS